ncbi:hypothetical protein CDL15_Pgr012887 [Punica granatum]|uniref:Uncharacterized protein n=1 Tax=Punica granatum TaxID=22663 RepID=A0A218XF99_PUNGR|nr:hypothetical protein CDL15_Pgr012887 [Punica granatum]PKI48864.1 hypothetical protein CRG98_030712 [Punica granatum]
MEGEDGDDREEEEMEMVMETQCCVRRIEEAEEGLSVLESLPERAGSRDERWREKEKRTEEGTMLMVMEMRVVMVPCVRVLLGPREGVEKGCHGCTAAVCVGVERE